MSVGSEMSGQSRSLFCAESTGITGVWRFHLPKNIFDFFLIFGRILKENYTKISSGKIDHMSANNHNNNNNNPNKFVFGTVPLEGVLLECAKYLESKTPSTFTEAFLWSEVGLKFTELKNKGRSEASMAKWLSVNKLLVNEFFFGSPPYPFHTGDGSTVYFEETGVLGMKFLGKFKVSADDYCSLIKNNNVSYQQLCKYGASQGVVIPPAVYSKLEAESFKSNLLELFRVEFVLPTSPLVKGWKENKFLSTRVFVDCAGQQVHEVERICGSDSDGEIPKLKNLPQMSWGKKDVVTWLGLWDEESRMTTLLHYLGYHTCMCLPFYFYCDDPTISGLPLAVVNHTIEELTLKGLSPNTSYAEYSKILLNFLSIFLTYTVEAVTNEPRLVTKLAYRLVEARHMVAGEPMFLVQWKTGQFGRIPQKDIVEGTRLRSSFYQSKVENKKQKLAKKRLVCRDVNPFCSHTFLFYKK